MIGTYNSYTSYASLFVMMIGIITVISVFIGFMYLFIHLLYKEKKGLLIEKEGLNEEATKYISRPYSCPHCNKAHYLTTDHLKIFNWGVLKIIERCGDCDEEWLTIYKLTEVDFLNDKGRYESCYK